MINPPNYRLIVGLTANDKEDYHIVWLEVNAQSEDEAHLIGEYYLCPQAKILSVSKIDRS